VDTLQVAEQNLPTTFESEKISRASSKGKGISFETRHQSRSIKPTTSLKGPIPRIKVTPPSPTRHEDPDEKPHLRPKFLENLPEVSHHGRNRTQRRSGFGPKVTFRGTSHKMGNGPITNSVADTAKPVRVSPPEKNDVAEIIEVNDDKDKNIKMSNDHLDEATSSEQFNCCKCKFKKKSMGTEDESKGNLDKLRSQIEESERFNCIIFWVVVLVILVLCASAIMFPIIQVLRKQTI
jgi:hypothetical protein